MLIKCAKGMLIRRHGLIPGNLPESLHSALGMWLLSGADTPPGLQGHSTAGDGVQGTATSLVTQVSTENTSPQD